MGTKFTRVAAAAPIILVSFACSKHGGSTAGLPELPAELAHDLEPSVRGSALVTKSGTMLASPRHAPANAGPGKPSACARSYLSQAIYPLVSCNPIDAISEVLLRASDESTRDVPDAATRAKTADRYYKLSAFGKHVFDESLFCRLTGGPWPATAVSEEQCSGASDQWTLSVAVPQIQLAWSGGWEDMPSYPSLQVTMGDRVQVGVPVCDCCAGFKSCAGACILEAVPCNSETP